MPTPGSTVDQMICAYDPDNPTDNRGFGPVAASFGMAEALSLFKIAGHMLRPPGDVHTGLNSVACNVLPSGQELLVRRVVTRDALLRDNMLSQALIGAPGQFPADLCLGLDPVDWPLGEDLPHVALGELLHRQSFAELHRENFAELRSRGVDGAARLREAGRDPARTEILTHLVTWMLTEPTQQLSIAAHLLGDHPRATLLGLVDILGPLIPGPWSFSTLESAESGAYRLIVMPDWPRPGSPEYGRLRLAGQLAPDGPAHTTASMLVARYQQYGPEGLDIVSRDAQRWQRMQPVERAESLSGKLALHSIGPVPLALPPGKPTRPASSDYAVEGATEPAAPAADTIEKRPETVTETLIEQPGPPLEPPPLTPGFHHPPVEDPPFDSRPLEAAALVETLIRSFSLVEGQDLCRQLDLDATHWSEQEIDAACLKAIDFRLGLADPGGGVSAWGRVSFEALQWLYELLICKAIAREKPAQAWAEFLRDRARAAALPEPLRAVVLRMFDEHERRLITIHPGFFVVLGPWAIPRALRLNARTRRSRTRGARVYGRGLDQHQVIVSALRLLIGGILVLLLVLVLRVLMR